MVLAESVVPLDLVAAVLAQVVVAPVVVSGGTLGAGGGAGNVGGFIGLLQQLQQLRNREDNLTMQLRTLTLLEANQGSRFDWSRSGSAILPEYSDRTRSATLRPRIHSKTLSRTSISAIWAFHPICPSNWMTV